MEEPQSNHLITWVLELEEKNIGVANQNSQ
jgi:hypothetical protein